MSTQVLSFFKDWGGAITVLIAVVYTFPTSLWDRIASGEEKLLNQSRQVLADGSSMVIEKLTTLAKLSDKNAIDLVDRMYNVKFYNLIATNRTLLDRTLDTLSSNEVATFAGLLRFSGNIGDALRFYDAAIRKARAENVFQPNILRDRSQALFVPGPTQDIPLARAGYLEVLASLSRSGDARAAGNFGVYLSELAYYEASTGDWTCGGQLYAVSDRALGAVRANEPMIASHHDKFRVMFATLKPGPGLTTQGCPYRIPGQNP